MKRSKGGIVETVAAAAATGTAGKLRFVKLGGYGGMPLVMVNPVFVTAIEERLNSENRRYCEVWYIANAGYGTASVVDYRSLSEITELLQA